MRRAARDDARLRRDGDADQLRLVGTGRSNAAVARLLFLSEATVNTARDPLMAKSDLSSRTQGSGRGLRDQPSGAGPPRMMSGAGHPATVRIAAEGVREVDSGLRDVS